uniref:SHC-transforming protein 1 n=1 Tax=Romanomermis culicivorax TaxID=13658 RepID=A0A915K7S8_ROMCU
MWIRRCFQDQKMSIADPEEHAPDAGRLKRGISFDAIYVGCISILRSYKDTLFEDRSSVTKECILRVAESARLITYKDRKLPSYVKESIKTTTDLRHSGSSVELTISTNRWSVKLFSPAENIFCHDMRNVSFASAGDGITSNFVAYVAKNDENDRRCYVFDCPSGTAQAIITTMGHAFRLRYEQVKRSPGADSHHRHADNQRLERSTSSSDRDSAPPLPPSNGSSIIHPPTNLDLLQKEIWFLGKLSREKSEELVTENGQFLVRQSEAQPNQFVLTGMQDNTHRHLLLIDEEGNVRMKDKKFDDICHLIQYHRGNNIPISSAESFLILRTPVNRYVHQRRTLI